FASAAIPILLEEEPPTRRTGSARRQNPFPLLRTKRKASMKCFSSAARLAFTFIAMLGLASQVAAAEQVPFQGKLEGVVTRSGAPPIVSVNVSGAGVATQLGQFAVSIPHEVNVVTRIATGTYTFVAANGDTLTATFIGHATPAADPT